MIPKKIKYKVLSACGDADVGDVLDGFLLFRGVDSSVSIVYVPKTKKYECGCLIMCTENINGQYQELIHDSFVNLSDKDNKVISDWCK
jgi:hypothetical protein